MLLPPLPAPEKILCIGVNYANRNAEYKDGSEQAKYPSMFFRNPGSFTGHDQPLIRPPESTQLDYEGEIALIIGREGRRIPKERAMDHVAGYTLCNEGTIRDWTRHSKFNVTQGKNFDATGSLGPYFVTADEIDRGQAAASHHHGERRGAPGRHHGEPDLHVRRPDRLRDDLHDASAPATSWSPARRSAPARASIRRAGSSRATWWRSRCRGSACCATGLRMSARCEARRTSAA